MEQKVRRFIRFLRKRRIKYRHRRNFDHHKHKSVHNLSYVDFIKSNRYRMIFGAFYCSKTDEGELFWEIIDKKWERYYRSYA